MNCIQVNGDVYAPFFYKLIRQINVFLSEDECLALPRDGYNYQYLMLDLVHLMFQVNLK